MVRNFGEKRKKKNNKKSKGKGSRGGKEMDEVTCRDVVIYVPPDQRHADDDGKSKQDSRSPKTRNTYRSKRIERQRQKKDRKGSRGDWGYDDYPEENEDDDDGDFGGEYDEIIRTGPSRLEAREAREARAYAQMASTSGSFINLASSRHGRNYGRTRTGRRGYNQRNGHDGGHSSGRMILEEFSMLDLLVMALGSRLSL